MLGRRSRIEIKTPEQLRHMRAAGLVVAGALARTAELVAPGVTTGQLDAAAAEFITAAGARSNFKGYHGFPGVICTSVNDEVVHGIPGDRVLREGDLISIDCGAIVEGWHGDAAITVPVGEVSPVLLALSEATERALWAGIARALVGGRLSDIGAGCEAALNGRYGIVQDYVVTRGSPEVTVLEDDWTVATVDGSVAAHWEHSVALTDSGPVVLTAEDGGASRLAEWGVPMGSVE